MTEIVVVGRRIRIAGDSALDPAVEFESWFWWFRLLNDFLCFLVSYDWQISVSAKVKEWSAWLSEHQGRTASNFRAWNQKNLAPGRGAPSPRPSERCEHGPEPPKTAQLYKNYPVGVPIG